MRFIDLSVTIRNQSFEPGGPEIVRMDHKEAARRRAADFNFLPSGYPDSMAMAHERVTLSAHGGTHVDAPVHYGPLCEGKPAKSIEYVPLEWCYGPGVVLDVSHKKPAEYITKADVIAAYYCGRIQQSISTIPPSLTFSQVCIPRPVTGSLTRASA